MSAGGEPPGTVELGTVHQREGCLMTAKTGPRRRSRASGALSDVASVVTARRLVLGLTQADLADLAGVGLSSVRSLEAGRASVTLEVAIGVLGALGLAVAVGPRAALQGGDGVALLTLKPAGC
jgi:DNA-binding XRE family transcriptional regulator